MKKVIRRTTYLILSGLFLIAAIFIYLFVFGGLERAVNSQIKTLLGADMPLRVRVANIKGDIISGLVAEGITIRYLDSTFNYELARINSATFGYSISNLWYRDYLFDYIYIDSADIIIRSDSTGKFILPQRGRSETNTTPPNFKIVNLQVNRTSFSLIGRDDSLLVSDIVFAGGIESDDGTFSALVNHCRFNSNHEDISLAAAAGKISYSGSDMIFQDFTILNKESRLKANGALNLTRMVGSVQIDADRIDLSKLSKYIGKNLKGVVDLNGTISIDSNKIEGSVDLGGKFMFASLDNIHVKFKVEDKLLTLDTLIGTAFENCSLDGSGYIDFGVKPEKYQFEGDVRNFNLLQIVKNTYHSDLSGHILLNGSSLKTESLVLKFGVDLYDSEFDVYPIHAAKGDVTVTRDSISFLPGFGLSYYENNFNVSGNAVYKGDIDLDIVADLPNLDRWRGRLFIDQPGGKGMATAKLSGRSGDPDLSGQFVSDSLWLYGVYAGMATSQFEIERFLHRRIGYVNSSFVSGNIYATPYDSASVYLRLDSTIAYIDSLLINNTTADVVSDGYLDYGIYPQSLVLNKLDVTLFDRLFDNSNPIRVDVDSTGFSFDQCRLERNGSRITLDGRVGFTETMDASLFVERIPVRPWAMLFEDTVEYDGFVSCEAGIGGTFDSPTIHATGTVDSLTFKDLILGDASTILNYSDRTLTIENLHIDSDPGEYDIEGSVRIDLAFSSNVGERLLPEPMDLHMTASDERFELVTLFLPTVENLNGEFYTDVRLTGTPTDPHLEGIAYIKNAALKYFDIVDTIYTDSAGVTMRDNRIIIESVIAYEKDRRHRNRHREAVIRGEIIVKTLDLLYYDLDVELKEDFFFVYDLEDISGVVSEGHLKIIGDSPPTVSGDVSLKSVLYLVNFASADEGSPIMTSLFSESLWDIDINIEILSNYWIKNEDIDAEFAGELNLIREDGIYRFIGELEIRRGKGYLFDKVFQLEPGSRVIFEDVEYPNPRLDIQATIRVATSNFEEEETNEVEDVTIQITGTLDFPEINAAGSGTDFSNQDFIPWIVTESGSSGRFEDRMIRFVSSQASRIGSRQLSQLGVETFEINPGYGGSDELANTTVKLGKYWGAMYVYGQSAVSFQSGQEYGFELRFNRSLMLEGRRDELELYHLGFNLHWEF